jgi:hypothetical protein
MPYAASALLRRWQIIISNRLNEKEALELIVSGVPETIADATLSG